MHCALCVCVLSKRACVCCINLMYRMNLYTYIEGENDYIF